jgi:HEAT repeat protein
VTAADRRRAVVIAGHRGDDATARSALGDDDPSVRSAALGALDRTGSLTAADLLSAFEDVAAAVRGRAAEIAARHVDPSAAVLLDDPDDDVVEMAAWACGEQLEGVADVDLSVVARLADLAIHADPPLVREAAAAALGAIGHPAGLPAILHACSDKPHIRRRAVLALAPFEGDEVEAAIERALTDRDWQVRQAAEDLRRAAGQFDT